MYSINSIKQKLIKAFPNASLSIIDDSNQHIGHVGYNSDRPSHITISIISDIFQNISTIESHKMIYKILKDEIAHGLHAISINCKTD